MMETPLVGCDLGGEKDWDLTARCSWSLNCMRCIKNKEKCIEPVFRKKENPDGLQMGHCIQCFKDEYPERNL